MFTLKTFDGFFWLVIALVLLVYLQRWLHREIQLLFLTVTRNPGITQIIFALLFFPGVLLHEGSHFLAAKLLGVRTGRFSLLPQAQRNGKLRLGYVETASGGFVRDALIGAASLFLGCVFIAWVATQEMHLLPLWGEIVTMDWTLIRNALTAIPGSADFWLWFYLAFTVSSTMMPSQSDRHSWLSLGILIIILLLVVILAGAGEWMLVHLAVPFNNFLRAMALIFSLSGVFHIILLVPFFLVNRILGKFFPLD